MTKAKKDKGFGLNISHKKIHNLWEKIIAIAVYMRGRS